MTWQKITVKQFQQLESIIQQYEGADAAAQAELDVQTIAIIHGLTIDQIDSLPLSKYQELEAQASFIDVSKLPPEPRRHITINGRRYRFIYDIRDIRAHRYIEAKTFEEGGLIQNLHKIAASMCIPQRRRLGFWQDAAWKAEDHSLYAADMQAVPITAIYGSVVFFCNVFAKSMISLGPYLKSELMKTGKIPEAEIDQQISALQTSMDGLTRLHL